MDEEKEEKPRSRLQKILGDAIAKETVRIDSALLELKRLYDIMTEDERKLWKAWIDQVVPLDQRLLSNLIGRLHVDLRYPFGEEELRVTGVPALAMKNAIEHWERGEYYNPKTFEEVSMIH